MRARVSDIAHSHVHVNACTDRILSFIQVNNSENCDGPGATYEKYDEHARMQRQQKALGKKALRTVRAFNIKNMISGLHTKFDVA